MQLTPDQQTECVRLLPLAKRVARAFSRDDEYESEAFVLLCEAVLAYDATRSDSIDDFVGMRIRSRLIDFTTSAAQRECSSITPNLQYRDKPPITELVESLPVKLRDLARYCWLEKRTQEDASVHFGVSLSCVKKRLAKAKSYLRRDT